MRMFIIDVYKVKFVLDSFEQRTTMSMSFGYFVLKATVSRLQCHIRLITLFTENHHSKSIKFRFNHQT